MTTLTSILQGNLQGYILVALLLFVIGLFVVLSRRTVLVQFMGVELMLNSAALNFVVFNRFVAPAACDGQITAIFVIAVAAAEVVVGMAIFVALFRHRGTIDVNRMNTMKD